MDQGGGDLAKLKWGKGGWEAGGLVFGVGEGGGGMQDKQAKILTE